MKHLILCLCLLVAAAGCVYPASQVRSSDERPQISFSGAPAASILYVDGLTMGEPKTLEDANQTLLLEPGTHKIEVRASDGSVLLSETVFLGSGSLKNFDLSER